MFMQEKLERNEQIVLEVFVTKVTLKKKPIEKFQQALSNLKLN